MNILDIDQEKVNRQMNANPDKLKMLFDLSGKLQTAYKELYAQNGRKLSEGPVDLFSTEGQREIKDTIWNTTEELYELANTFKKREWVQSNYETDMSRVFDELADAAMFFITLAGKLGLDSDKFAEIVYRKVEVNLFRIGSEY